MNSRTYTININLTKKQFIKKNLNSMFVIKHKGKSSNILMLIIAWHFVIHCLFLYYFILKYDVFEIISTQIKIIII